MHTGRFPTATPWHPPPGWPIVEPGLLMTGIDGVMFVRMSSTLDERTYDRFLEEQARAIDARQDDHSVGVIYDALTLDSDARRRQRGAAVLNTRREKLARTTAGFAMVTPSPIVRGVLQATFWLAPPPYPWTVSDDIEKGLRWLAPRLPGLDPLRLARRYRDLIRERSR